MHLMFLFRGCRYLIIIGWVDAAMRALISVSFSHKLFVLHSIYRLFLLQAEDSK
jgi:hypothetical protein